MTLSPAAPDWGRDYGIENLWTEIKDGLWVGGTADEDIVSNARESRNTWVGGIDISDAVITKDAFDSVVTMYSWAQPVDWLVEEYRWGIYDSPDMDVDLTAMRELVVWAHRRWKDGKSVLVRCQAGLSRSPFVTALILVRDGLTPEEATALIREKRSNYCLSLNGSKRGGSFHNILYNTDPEFWRDND